MRIINSWLISTESSQIISYYSSRAFRIYSSLETILPSSVWNLDQTSVGDLGQLGRCPGLWGEDFTLPKATPCLPEILCWDPYYRASTTLYVKYVKGVPGNDNILNSYSFIIYWECYVIHFLKAGHKRETEKNFKGTGAKGRKERVPGEWKDTKNSFSLFPKFATI